MRIGIGFREFELGFRGGGCWLQVSRSGFYLQRDVEDVQGRPHCGRDHKAAAEAAAGMPQRLEAAVDGGAGGHPTSSTTRDGKPFDPGPDKG